VLSITCLYKKYCHSLGQGCIEIRHPSQLQRIGTRAWSQNCLEELLVLWIMAFISALIQKANLANTDTRLEYY
jgi:hypothetical protein